VDQTRPIMISLSLSMRAALFLVAHVALLAGVLFLV